MVMEDSPLPLHFLPAATNLRLQQRAQIIRRIRQFFEARQFIEVETPTLSHDVVVDLHLDPLAVTLFRDAREPNQGEQLWLQTSPEFGMKRLLVAGMSSIFQITRAYRGGEIGALHNPEFTMLEWYRVGDDYAAGRELLAQFAESLIGCGLPEQITFRAAFLQHAGLDPFSAEGLSIPAAKLDEILVTQVEPNLGQSRPTIMYDYPATQAALAQVHPASAGQPAVAERFELYWKGVELANGYHELLDPAILRQRNRLNNIERSAAGKFTLPEESRLLAAMDQGLPACAGTALGIDRLVMLLLGASTIQEVMAFPIDRA